MSEVDKSVKAEADPNDRDRIANPGDEVGTESVPPSSGLRERVRKLLEGTQQGRPGTKRESAKDRTRSLVLLIGGSVGALLLFIGVFSAPTARSSQQTGGPSTPNLGRAQDSRQAVASRGSVTPLLSADVQSDDGHSDQLSPADIQGTSSRTSDEQEGVAAETRFSPVPLGAGTTPARFDGPEISSPPVSDPLPAYRLNSAGTPTYSYGGPSPASTGVLDECWALLDSPVLAPEVVQLFRTARKRNSSVWAISQTLEDFVGTEKQPRLHGPGIVKNSTTKIIGQQRGDLNALANHLYLNDVVLKEIKGLAPPRKGRSAEAVLALGERAETTQVIRLVPTAMDYWICTTFQRERMYRSYFLARDAEKPLFERYRDLARLFPRGLAERSELPEETSGAVNSAWGRRRSAA